jgi:hypothetical protein
MLQLYFLSVAANFLAGVTLSADWMGERFISLAGILEALSIRRAKTITGLAALLVGLGTLFVPAAPPIVLGDLFPSVVGLAVGIALLFEVFKQDALYSGDRSPRNAQNQRTPSAYRTALGALGFAAAVLHYFLPERLLF